MSEPTPTPRSDAEIEHVSNVDLWCSTGKHGFSYDTHGAVAPAEFSRTLERELAAERATREQLEQECKAWEESTRDVHNAMTELAALKLKLSEEAAIVDRVWKALGIDGYTKSKPFAIWEHVEQLKLKLEVARGGFGKIIKLASHLCYCKSIAQEAPSQLNSGSKRNPNWRG